MRRLVWVILVFACSLPLSTVAFGQVRPAIAPIVRVVDGQRACAVFETMYPNRRQEVNAAVVTRLKACIFALTGELDDARLKAVADSIEHSSSPAPSSTSYRAEQKPKDPEGATPANTSNAGNASSGVDGRVQTLLNEAMRLVQNSSNENGGNNARPQDPAATQEKTAQAAASPDLNAAKEAAIHHQLLGVYLSYVHLKRWVRRLQLEQSSVLETGLTEDKADALDTFNRLSDHLHSRLAEHGLLKPFSAELLVGFVLTSMGAQTGAAATHQVSGSVDSQNTQPAGFVQWETIHFLSDYQRWWRPDLAFGGTIGFQPVMTLVDVPMQQGSTQTVGPLGTFQQAFVWKTNVGASFRIGDAIELTPFGAYGQTVLTSLDTLLGSSGQSVVGTASNNVTGRAEGNSEAGVRFNIFGESLDLLHVDKSSLSPMVWFSVGVRRDSRFKDQGALANFEGANLRAWYTFAVDALEVVRRASTTQTDTSPFSITVRVDYQTALKGHADRPNVPSGTSVFLSATTDILKAFRGKK